MQRKTIFLIVRVVLALALIAFVLSRMQFRDRLVFRTSSGKPARAGRVLSVDKQHVVFRTVEGEVLEVSRSDLAGGRPQYGLVRVVRRLRWKPFGLAFLCLAGTYLVTTIRWRWLCVARKIPLNLGEALRLCFIGFFFNNAVPGATGGDVVRAYFASKNRTSKTEAFASVILDRIIGLTALIFLAGGALALQTGDPKFRRMAQLILVLLVIIVAFTTVYYSRRLRKVFGLNFFGRLLPFQELIKRVDRAFFLYRYHKGTLIASFFISFFAHGFTILNHVLLGRALGFDLPLSTYLVYVPIGQVASAIPIFPGGWGVREAAYGTLFARSGLPFSYGAALSILHGVCVLAWSLVGGIVFMVGHDRLPDKPIGGFIEGEESIAEEPA